MLITTERCIIRKFTTDDAAQLNNVLSDNDVMQYIEPTFNMQQTMEFIADAGLCDPPLVYALVWKKTDLVIGHVIFHRFEEDSFEIGWILCKEFWGLGIASEVTGFLVEYARECGARSCVIECEPLQKATIRIAEKHRFLYDGQSDDCSIYRLIL